MNTAFGHLLWFIMMMIIIILFFVPTSTKPVGVNIKEKC